MANLTSVVNAGLNPVKKKLRSEKDAFLQAAFENANPRKFFEDLGLIGQTFSNALRTQREDVRSSNDTNSSQTRGKKEGVIKPLKSIDRSLISIDKTLKNIHQMMNIKSKQSLYDAEKLSAPVSTDLMDSGKESRDKSDTNKFISTIFDLFSNISKVLTLLLGGITGLVSTITSIFSGSKLAKLFGKKLPNVISLGGKSAGVRGAAKVLGGLISGPVGAAIGIGVGGLEGAGILKDFLNERHLKRLEGKVQKGEQLNETEKAKLKELELQGIAAGSENNLASRIESGDQNASKIAAATSISQQEIDQARLTGKASIAPTTITSNMGFDYNAFTEALGNRESGGKGGGYKADNKIGFVGKYQLGTAALEDAGLLKRGTFKKYKNKGVYQKDAWAGMPGAGSLEEYLNNGPLQEQVMKEYTRRNYREAVRTKLIKPTDSAEKKASVLGAMHLGGAGGARDLLEKGISRKDAFGTPVSEYATLGAKSQRKLGVLAPTSQVPTLDKTATVSQLSTSAAAGSTSVNAQTNVIGGGSKSAPAPSSALPTPLSPHATDPTFDMVREMIERH